VEPPLNTPLYGSYLVLYLTGVEVTDTDKHSSLLPHRINYDRKEYIALALFTGGLCNLTILYILECFVILPNKI
jgi:hypothetical protein